MSALQDQEKRDKNHRNTCLFRAEPEVKMTVNNQAVYNEAAKILSQAYGADASFHDGQSEFWYFLYY